MAAGSRGELLVARIRLALSGAVMLLSAFALAFATDRRESLVGFIATGSLFAFSILVYRLVRKNPDWPWIGLATGCFDVTLVSATLASFLLMDAPHTAVNSKVVFEAYFLAMATTTLRYDKRVCIVAGGLGLLQYLAIVTVASTQWDLNSMAYAPFPYGMFSWRAQISRLIAMSIAVAISLVVVSRTQQLIRLSTSDALTGLFNRGYFKERVSSEISRAARLQAPLVIAMIDVDRFKEFNDRFGHREGDKALRGVAATLTRSLRKTDIVARYGGDEFVVAMPDTDILTARNKLDELRALIATTSFSPRRGPERVGLGVSVGIAGFPRDGASDEELIGVADARLFEAKRNGRDNVVYEGLVDVPAVQATEV
jgi:diguanylate cyclase (GGDEF)-like protein